MDLLNLFSRLPAAVAQGLIWGIMALGVYITFRVLNLADLTVDGTFALGGAVSVMLILAGWPAWLSVIAAIAAGLAAGLVTGLLHTKLGIPAILAGILTQFSLYSINLRVMGMKSNQTANLKNYGMFFENGKGFLVSSRYIPMAIVMGGVIAVVVDGVKIRLAYERGEVADYGNSGPGEGLGHLAAERPCLNRPGAGTGSLQRRLDGVGVECAAHGGVAGECQEDVRGGAGAGGFLHSAALRAE